jgi:hypothetical protein
MLNLAGERRIETERERERERERAVEEDKRARKSRIDDRGGDG